MTGAVTGPKKNRALLLLVIPLISCVISSVAGIVLGQLGNLFYLVLGDASKCLAIPGFCGLFLVTFGLSFLVNKLLRNWLFHPGR